MALDRHTLGRNTQYVGSPPSTTPAHRYHSGVLSLPAQPTTLADAQHAWSSGWGQTLTVPTPSGWSAFVHQIQGGRGGIVFGKYDQLDAAYRTSSTYNAPHSLYINEQLVDGSFWGYDPVVGYPMVYPYDVLHTYADSYNGFTDRISAAFTRVTPLIPSDAPAVPITPIITPPVSPPTPPALPPPTGPAPTDLQLALSGAASGATIDLRNSPSAYTGQFTISKPLSLIGGSIIGRLFVKANDVTINGLEISGSTAGAQQGMIDVPLNAANRLTILNTHIHHGGGTGLKIRGDTGHLIDTVEIDHMSSLATASAARQAW